MQTGHKHYRSKATVREMGLGFSIRANPSTEGVTNYNALTSTVAVAKCKRKNKGELANTGPMNNGIRLV